MGFAASHDRCRGLHGLLRLQALFRLLPNLVRPSHCTAVAHTSPQLWSLDDRDRFRCTRHEVPWRVGYSSIAILVREQQKERHENESFSHLLFPISSIENSRKVSTKCSASSTYRTGAAFAAPAYSFSWIGVYSSAGPLIRNAYCEGGLNLTLSPPLSKRLLQYWVLYSAG